MKPIGLMNYLSMSKTLITNVSSDNIIALLESLPLEQVIMLKYHIDTIVGNDSSVSSTLSDDELLFISTLFKDK